MGRIRHFPAGKWFLLVLFAGFLCVLSARCATFFVEAENFAVSGDGWRPVSDNRSEVRPASRVSTLWGAVGAGDSTASTRITIPAEGMYRLWVRYMEPGWRGPFHVGVLQNGKEVAGKDFDVEARKDVPVWTYGWVPVDDIKLSRGEIEIRLSKYKNQNCSGYSRHVDCILLTDDMKLVPDHTRYGPQTWLRVTIGDCYEKLVYFHIFADHYRNPWYGHYAIGKDGLTVGLAPGNASAYFKNNERSPWVNISQMIYQDSGAILVMSTRYDYYTITPEMKVKMEFATEPDDAKVVKTFVCDNQPGGISIVVPPDLTPGNLKYLVSDMEVAEATGKIADAMKWPAFGKKPVLYPFFVSAGTDPWIPHDKRVSDREWKTLDYFGFSNREKERIGGAWYMKNDCYCQPDTRTMEVAIKNAVDAFKKDGKKVENIANCMLMDEPCGQPLSHIAGCPGCTEQFRQWMKELKKTPQDLGVTSWDAVRPVEESQAEKEPFLYYYSQRFRTRALSKFMRLQRELLLPAYGRTFPVDVNFSDGATYYANFYGQGVDYFELLENDDQNAIWGENWGNGAASPQCTTYNVELMRSAAMKKGQIVGHYLIAYAGRLPWDIKLKAVSQTARDVKMMENFWYGPSWTGHEGGPLWSCSGWYAKPETWYSNAELVREIGGAEDLLFTAKKKKADVAILYSSSSDIWSVSRTFSYGFDRMFIWLSLTHGCIPVDFLSEKTVEEKGLSGYRVCYFAGRNLTKAAAEQLKYWVKGGGVLVATAGAGARDEYNRPMTALDDILPASYGKLDEFQHYQNSGSYLFILTPKESVTMRKDGTKFDVLSVKQELLPKPDSQVLGTFSDGSPAVVMKKIGAGSVYSFGFLPGLAYMRPAIVARNKLVENIEKSGKAQTDMPDPSLTLSDTDLVRRSHCPWKYPAEIRNTINMPALLAKVDIPVLCSVPLVDAVCMEADRGIVVPLANYTLQPLKEVTFAVESTRRVRRVESVHHGALQFKQEAGRVRFSLPLVETDFVKLYY